MTKSEAKYIAQKYEEHHEYCNLAIAINDKFRMEYHAGCMKLALQLFERFSDSHGFKSTTSAILWKDIPISKKVNKTGVHQSHCCIDHGCKYNDKDCPVVSGQIKQKYPCEDCLIK